MAHEQGIHRLDAKTGASEFLLKSKHPVMSVEGLAEKELAFSCDAFGCVGRAVWH